MIDIKSQFLQGLIRDVDNEITHMEKVIQTQHAEIRRLNRELLNQYERQVKSTDSMTVNTLMVCISQPDIESIGPVGATVLSRIRDMQTIEQVREYIDKLSRGKEE